MTFIEIAMVFLKAVTGELDSYTEKSGVIEVSENGNSVTLFTPSHIQFAKYGRGPGEKPPLDPLIEWITKKGIVTDKKEVRGTAFAIQRSIGEKGTKNWQRGAPNALQEAINNNISKYFGDLSKVAVITQSNELNKIYEKEFPKKVEFKI